MARPVPRPALDPELEAVALDVAHAEDDRPASFLRERPQHHHRLLEGASQPHRVPLVALLSHGELSELADRALRGSDRAATGRAGRAEAAVDDALPCGAVDGPHLQLV